jgi:hypothetical protein
LKPDFGRAEYSKVATLRGRAVDGGDVPTELNRNVSASRLWNSRGRIAQIDLPDANVQRAATYVAQAGYQGPFSVLSNGCTTWTRRVLRAGGIEPPLWASTPTWQSYWASTVGRPALHADIVPP